MQVVVEIKLLTFRTCSLNRFAFGVGTGKKLCRKFRVAPSQKWNSRGGAENLLLFANPRRENWYRFIQPPMHMHKGRKKPFGAYKRQTIHCGNLVRKFAAIRTNCETIRKPIACHIDEKQMAPLGPEMLMTHSRSHEHGLSKPNKHTRMRTHLRKHRPAQCKGNRCQRCGHIVFIAAAFFKTHPNLASITKLLCFCIEIQMSKSFALPRRSTPSLHVSKSMILRSVERCKIWQDKL